MQGCDHCHGKHADCPYCSGEGCCPWKNMYEELLQKLLEEAQQTAPKK
jgi:hypothetical protein